MALDTRGVMDGLLRGYSTVKNIQNDEERMQMQRDGIKENNRRYRESRNDTLARYAIDDERYQAEQKKEAERYQNEQERIKNNDAMSRKVQNAQLASYDANLKQSNAKFNREQKLAFLQDSMPILQAGFDRALETGEINPIFDNEYVKGGAYDPRRYTPAIVRAAYDVVQAVPKIKSGEIDYQDKQLTASIGKLLENNVKQGIGEIDAATGKKIKDKEYLRHDFVADIDPNREGDQSAFVVGVKITYEDGSTKIAPVTEGRSTSPDDPVKVIPLDLFMKDIGDQIKTARQVFTSKHYNNLFGAKDGQNKEFEKEYRQALVDIAQDETKAISELMDPTEEDIEAVKSRFEDRRKAVATIYGKAIGEPDPGSQSDADMWAGKDDDKVQFIALLTQDRGIDVSKLDATQLEGMYQQVVAEHKKQKRDEEYGQKLAKWQNEKSDNANNTTLASVTTQPKPSNSLYHSQYTGEYEAPPMKSLKDILPEMPEAANKGFVPRTF